MTQKIFEMELLRSTFSQQQLWVFANMQEGLRVTDLPQLPKFSATSAREQKVGSGGEMFLGSVVLAMARKRVTLFPRGAQEYRDHFVMLLTPRGRTGGSGRRVACEQKCDPESMPELCGPASPCSTRGGCGHRGKSEYNREFENRPALPFIGSR
jgi:hypothetical protein